MYIYGLPKSYDGVRDAVGRQMVCLLRCIRASSLQTLEAEEMKQWAEANQEAIMKPAYVPRFFQLKKGAAVVWTGKGETSLLVPLLRAQWRFRFTSGVAMPSTGFSGTAGLSFTSMRRQAFGH